VARLAGPSASRLTLLRAVQADAELTSIYFDLVAGAASIADLYTPKLAALLAA